MFPRISHAIRLEASKNIIKIIIIIIIVKINGQTNAISQNYNSTRPHLNLTHLMLIFFSIAFPWMLKLITINYLFSLKNLLSRFLLPEPPYSSSLILSSPPRGGAFLAAQVSPLSLSLSVNLCGRICRVIFAVFSLVAGKYFSFWKKTSFSLPDFQFCSFLTFIFWVYLGFPRSYLYWYGLVRHRRSWVRLIIENEFLWISAKERHGWLRGEEDDGGRLYGLSQASSFGPVKSFLSWSIQTLKITHQVYIYIFSSSILYFPLHLLDFCFF